MTGTQALGDGRDVQAKDKLRGAEAELRTVGVAQLGLEAVEPREERFDLGEELSPRRGQADGTRSKSRTPRLDSNAAIWPLTAGCWMP